MSGRSRALTRPTDDIRVQALRYLFVGGAAAVVDFGVLYLLTEAVGMHYLLSATIAFAVAVWVNYVLSVRWVFASRRAGHVGLEFAGFLVIAGIGLAITLGVLWVLTDLLGMYYLLSKIVATAVALVWNFLARRHLLFRPVS